MKATVFRVRGPEGLPSRIPPTESNFSDGLTSEFSIAISCNWIMAHNSSWLMLLTTWTPE